MNGGSPHDPKTYRDIWNSKPSLRAVYGDIYRRILAAAAPGLVLEIGGGSGNLKQTAPHVVSSDIVPAPWLDLVCDAQRLPFADGAFSNVVMLDVLHHIENPRQAIAEITRVLKFGGRFICCEPAITPVSALFYRLFHPEPFDMSADPLAVKSISADKNPWDANQAIPTLLVGRFREQLARAIPELTLKRVDWFSFVAYPLSGGFRPWSLLPRAIAGPLLTIEWALRGLLGRLAAFRLLAVYEKSS
jgi:SAM-dependent methyltransferase